MMKTRTKNISSYFNRFNFIHIHNLEKKMSPFKNVTNYELSFVVKGNVNHCDQLL